MTPLWLRGRLVFQFVTASRRVNEAPTGKRTYRQSVAIYRGITHPKPKRCRATALHKPS